MVIVWMINVFDSRGKSDSDKFCPKCKKPITFYNHPTLMRKLELNNGNKEAEQYFLKKWEQYEKHPRGLKDAIDFERDSNEDGRLCLEIGDELIEIQQTKSKKSLSENKIDDDSKIDTGKLDNIVDLPKLTVDRLLSSEHFKFWLEMFYPDLGWEDFELPVAKYMCPNCREMKMEFCFEGCWD